MPTYNGITWRDYKVLVRPIGWRKAFHFKSWYFIPYLNGTNVDLAITIRTESNEKREFLYNWILYRFDGKQEHLQSQGSESFVNNAQCKIIKNLPIPYLSYPDRYNLQVRLHDKQEDKRSANFVVANFTLIDRDAFTLRLGIGLLFVIATALIALAIKVWGDS